jgi:ABC-2 type transport system ATP-binding protein
MDAIATHDLTKVYRSHLGKIAARSLDALNLRVAEREVFGFLGRNGAGKTTTIKILCSLLRPTAGTAEVFGGSVRARKTRRLIGYLPENPYFYEYLTPRETLDFYGRLHGLDRAARAGEWEKLSGLLDLGDIASQRVRGFSKGMRQRLGFAVALVGDPPLLILDEPMTGLDPLGRRTIRELILRLHSEKKTVFFSSHVLGDVEQICDRVGILVKGQLTSQGRLDELLTRKVELVEVIAVNLSPEAAAEVGAQADSVRQSEAGHHFHVNELGRADDLVRLIHTKGGSLTDFTPVKESLEEHFMRHQEEVRK